MNWILILTVFYAGESARVEHIEGFTKESCLAAVALWNQRMHLEGDFVHGFAICVAR